MNRKQFLKNLALAGAFSILPAAKTYKRIWTPKKIPIWEWIDVRIGYAIAGENIRAGTPVYLGPNGTFKALQDPPTAYLQCKVLVGGGMIADCNIIRV